MEPVDLDVADHLAAAEERLHAVQQLLAGGQHPDPHGAERLVPGEPEEVDPQVVQPDPGVGHGLGGVGQDQGPGGMGPPGDLGHRVDGAEHVRHGRHGHHPGPLAQQPVQGVQVEQVVPGDRHGPDPGPGHAGHQLPGHQVGVVLHLGDQDLVALAEVAQPPGVGDQVDGLADVLGEHRGPLGGADEAGHLAPGLLEQLGGLLGQGVDTPVHVGVVPPVVVVHGVQDLPRLLAGGGRVQVDERLAVDPALKDREVAADGGHVQRRGRGRHRGPPGTGSQVAGSPRQRS